MYPRKRLDLDLCERAQDLAYSRRCAGTARVARRFEPVVLVVTLLMLWFRIAR